MKQVPLALAFRSATHNIIFFINQNCVAMKQISPSHDYCIASVYTIATERTNVRSVCTVWPYVCSVCTERTVLLVPLILLVKFNVLVDTSAQIKVAKGPERGQIELSKLLSQHFCCSNNCMSMDGQDVSMGGQYGGRFNRR